MAQPSFNIEVSELLETELGVQRHNIFLSVQQHGFGAVSSDYVSHQNLSKTFTAAVGANGHAAEQATGVAVAGFGIQNHSQIGCRAPIVLNPEVLRGRFLVTIIEFFFIDSLFNEEHIGA